MPLVVIVADAAAEATRPFEQRRLEALRSTAPLWLLVAVPSVVGLLVPAFYDVLHRDPAAIVDRHQYWRLLTAAVVQDGGIAGTMFNLVVLAIVGIAATARWSSRRSVIVFLVGAAMFNVIAAWMLDRAGGGNSAATFFLAAATLVCLPRTDRAGGLRAILLTAAIGNALIARNDAHGLSVIGGLAAGLLAPLDTRPRHAEPPRHKHRPPREPLGGE